MTSLKEGEGVSQIATQEHKCMTEGGGGCQKMSKLRGVIYEHPLNLYTDVFFV